MPSREHRKSAGKIHDGKDRLFLRVGDAMAVVGAFLWFAYNVWLPPIYNGRLCCDSIGYIDLAKSLNSWSAILTHYGWRTIGYPLFLRVHLWFAELLGGSAVADGVTLSLFTAFLLHVLGSWFLWSSLRVRQVPVPRWVLWLLLIHPALVADLALPITDGFAATLLLFAFGALLRSETAARGRGWRWALAAGVLLAWVALTRPTHYAVALLMIVLWMLMRCWVWVKQKHGGFPLMPVLCALAFIIIVAPRVVSCMRSGGGLDLYTSDDRNGFLRSAMDQQQRGARTYSLTFLDEQGALHQSVETVDDALFLNHFACLGAQGPAMSVLARCFEQNLRHLPLAFLKKTIALFDNIHINTYAAHITRYRHVLVNRAFDLLGWLGFGALLWLFVSRIGRRPSHPLWLPMVYTILYWLLSLIPSTDARYGFPLIPFSIVSLAFLLHQRATRRERVGWIAAGLLLVAVYLVQVLTWDAFDPLFRTMTW